MIWKRALLQFDNKYDAKKSADVFYYSIVNADSDVDVSDEPESLDYIRKELSRINSNSEVLIRDI